MINNKTFKSISNALQNTTLYGQLVCLLIVAVGLALAAGAWQADQERHSQWREGRFEYLARRSADLAVLFEQLPPSQRPELAALVSLHWLRITTEPTDLSHTPRLIHPELATALKDALGKRQWRLFAHEKSPRYALLQLQLADGQWLTARLVLMSHRPPQRHPITLMPLGVTLLVILIAAMLLTRWLTRPLTALADAAEALGRNRRQPPLQLKGSVEIARAATAFNRMQARINEHIDSRAQWFAAMSHDLKTPITRLKLRAEMLDDHNRERFSKDLDEMQALIQETLDFLREDYEEHTRVALDVNALIDTLCSDWAEQGFHVTVHGTATAPLATVPSALRRILCNLGENACFYAKNPHFILTDSPQHLEICVCDDGNGLPPEELEKVFQPFYRLERSRNRATGGSGLGLASARRLAESLDAQLTLENRPEGGLCARLILPRPYLNK